MVGFDFTALLCGVLWIFIIFFVFACLDFFDKKGGKK